MSAWLDGSTTGRSQQEEERRLARYDAAAWGVLADNSTDDTPAAQRAVDAAYAAGGGVVMLPEGHVKLSRSGGLTLKPGVYLRGRGEGTVIHQAAWGTWGTLGLGGLINVSGSVGSAVSLTTDAVLGTSTLVLTSTSGIARGDVLMLGADTVFGTDAPGTNRYTGEMVRIASVDSGTQLTIYGYARDTYLVSATASVQPLALAAGMGVSDLCFVNDQPATTNVSAFMDFFLARDLAFSNVSMLNGDIGGLNLTSVLGARVASVSARDFTDNPGGGQYGYGIFVARGSEKVMVTDGDFVNCRHGVSMGGQDDSRGIVRNCVVADSFASECHLHAFDTHAECEDITFSNCQVKNSHDAAFLMRGRSSKVLNPTIEHCGAGVSFYPDAHGSLLKGGSIRHIRNTSGLGHGVLLGGPDHVVVEDVLIANIAQIGVQFYTAADATITSNSIVRKCTIMNTGISNVSSKKAAINFDSGVGNIIEENLIIKAPSSLGENESSSTPMDVGILLDGATGCYVRNNRSLGFDAGGNIVFDSSSNANFIENNVELDRPDSAQPAALSWGPAGSLASNFPLDRVAGLASLGGLVSGRLQLAGGLMLRAGKRYSAVTFVSGTQAAVAPTHAFAVLVDIAGGIIVKSLDNTTAAWAANTPVTFTFSSPFYAYFDQPVYAALLVTAGTAPDLLALAISAAAGALTPMPAATAATGLTTPASLTSVGALTPATILPYCYLS